jgi:hypothetical protein
VLGRSLPLHDLAQQAQGHRVAQVRLEIEQQIDPGGPGALDRLQAQARVGRFADGFIFGRVDIEIEAFEPAGDAPAVQRSQGLRDCVAKTLDDAVFVADSTSSSGVRARSRVARSWLGLTGAGWRRRRESLACPDAA